MKGKRQQGQYHQRRDNMGYDTVYNTELGCAVSLGMKKDEIDELLGAGEKTFYYDYIDGLSIDYEDGRASYILISGSWSPWIVKHEISTSDSVDAVMAAYGETEIFDMSEYDENNLGLTSLLITYYFDSRGRSTDSIADMACDITFFLNDDGTAVKSISVSD